MAVAVEITLEEAATGATVDVEYEAVDRCERCHGNGAEPGTPIDTCERCGGSGQLRAVTRTAFGQLVRTQACDVCGGDGEDPRDAVRGVRRPRPRGGQRRKLNVDIPAGIADEQRIRLTGRGHAGERGGPAGDLYVLVRVTEDERFVRDGNDLVTCSTCPRRRRRSARRVTVPTLDGDEEIESPAGTQPGAVVTLRGKGMPSLRRGRRGDQRVVVNVVIPRKLGDEQRALLEQFADTLTEENLRERRRATSRCSRACAGRSAAVIRLAIRADAADAEAGARRADRPGAGRASSRSTATAGSSSRSTARPASCRPCPEGEAEVGGARVVVRGEEVPDDWAERWKRFHAPLLIGGRLYVRPPWEEPAVRPGRARAGDRPGPGVRHRHAPDDAAVPRAAARARAARARSPTSAAAPACWRSRRPSSASTR